VKPRVLLVLFAAALASACSGTLGPGGNGGAVVLQKQTFKLLKTPDPEFEASLADLLSGSYDTAAKNHAGDRPMDIGFTYSMSPKGAVNPYSEIEVSCIVREKHAGRAARALCRDLFRDLGVKLRRALAARQE